MRKEKTRLKWIVLSFVFVLTLLVTLELSWAQQSPVPVNNDLQSMNQEELQKEKLRQEIGKLQSEKEKLNSPWWKQLLLSPTFIVAIVTLISVIFGIWKYINQREVDSLRRANENFESIVTNLGSENSSIQAGAAASILTFLRPEYKSFHDQVFMILLANLKIEEHIDPVNKLLIDGFERAIRIRLKSKKKKDEQFELNLSHTNLYRVNLSGLDLSEADVAFSQLKHANLTDAVLKRIRGYKANFEKARLSRANLEEARLQKAQFVEAQFHDARLTSADFKKTDLTKAQFYQAKMQSAHLDNATLKGARFEQANLNDTFFRGASFNVETLKSITRAFNWQKAHFDDDVRDKLKELAESNG